jgi:hypothetical protein
MRNLSAFHQELFQFLEQKIGQPILSKDRLSNPEFLSEVIEEYNRSLNRVDLPNMARLEWDWLNSFSEEEFASLGLKSYFPKIYRGLPRLYHRDDPSRSRLKGSFTDLADLKKCAVDRALFSLYETFHPHPGSKVGILSWVLTDGLGDFMAAQETSRILSLKFPQIDIHIFVITKLESLRCSEFPLHLIHYEGEEKDQLRGLEFGMDFVLQIPTHFPNSEGVCSSMESLGEYGFLESSWFHPKSKGHSMGLHALEKGIFIRRHIKVAFAEIENRPLLQSLFGTELPGPYEVSSYLSRTRFHLAYLATQTGGSIYLHSLLKMFEWDEKNIDVCTPDLDWAIKWLESRQSKGLPLLEAPFGVKELWIEWNGTVHKSEIAKKGKILRLICPGVLSFSDMQKLIGLSGDWVGVRGNQSLSEVISSGKPFFYDGRAHSRYLMKDLLALAENRLSIYKTAVHAFRMIGQAFLWNLPEDLELWVDETHFQQEHKLDWFRIAFELGASMQDPDAIAGFKKFGLICSEERSISPYICHLVQRGLAHLEHPSLKRDERELTDLYGSGKINFTSLVTNLVKKIHSFK